MYRIVWPCLLAVGAFLTTALHPSRADHPALKETLALQEAMQTAIQDAEPAIVCILISRSEDYIKLGQTPAPDGSGKLGGFNLQRARDAARKVGSEPPLDETEKNDPLKRLDLKDAENVPESYGSGVIIDETGLVLTTEHLVRNATKIFVRLPGGKGSYADVHAADPRSDLAVLRLVEPLGKLKAIKLGDGGKARKGQWVISLANPFAAGFRDGSPSAAWGIVSNVRRKPAGPTNELERVKPLHTHGTLLQTDIRLNVGCSGGALLDLKGELIGLTTPLPAVTTSDTPGGFAIPIDAGIKRVIEVLKRGEEVEYGFLGVSLGTANAEPVRGPNGGIQIGGTVGTSPAALKGLMAGDVILSINGNPINDNDDLFLAIAAVLAGNEAKLEYVRHGQARSVTVVLDKGSIYGKPIASRRPTPVRGLRVDYLSVLMQSINQGGQPKVSQGVIVREVQDGSAAARVLRVNDIVTHVNGQPVATPADFYKKMAGLTGPVELTLSNAEKVTLN